MALATSILITGSTGRVGGALRAVWADNLAGGVPILWHGRRAGPGVDVIWDIGQNPPVGLPEGGIVLHLAGLTWGSAAALDENRKVTAAVCGAVRAAHHFVMSSAAVYAPGADPIAESVPPAPTSDYGRAKLAAERAAQAVAGDRVTVLRLANLGGADALLGNCLPGRMVTLDPIVGQARGPERSYIGPRVLAQALAALFGRVGGLPAVINLAQPGVIAMADLLVARGQPWCFGPPRAGAVARVVLATDVLAGLVPLPPATAASIVADLDSVPGWPR